MFGQFVQVRKRDDQIFGRKRLVCREHLVMAAVRKQRRNTFELYNRDEPFSDLLSELGGEGFAVGINDLLVAKIEDRRIVRHLEEAPHMGKETRVVPPAGNDACGQFAGGCSVAYGDVRDRYVGARRKLKK